MTSITGDSTAVKHQHILIFPYPAQGHMLPLLDLTHQLALQHFTITIVITPKNLPTLSPLLSAHPSAVHPLVLPFPPHPSLPAGVENIRQIGNHGNPATIYALSGLQDPISQWFRAHQDPPSVIISDFFLGWTLSLARALGVPRVAFYGIGAFTSSVIDHYWSNNSAAVESPPPVTEFHGLPGAPTFPEERLPTIVRICRGGAPELAFVRESLMANLRSWGCAFNTFEGLEGQYLSYLKRSVGHERVYGVGPVSLLGLAAEKAEEQPAGWEEVWEWLEGCEEDSVLYVCFGSQKPLNGGQRDALAAGLEGSGVRYLWVVKGESNAVERVAGEKGLVITGWAPQVAILGHKAVGGFLSHCGWNSALEGVAAGVRILGWPMEADQHVNAKLLVEDMGVAVRVCEGAETVPDPAQLAEAIGEAMGWEGRAEELREKAVAAVREGGSSLRDLDQLVRDLRKLPKPVAKTSSE